MEKDAEVLCLSQTGPRFKSKEVGLPPRSHRGLTLLPVVVPFLDWAGQWLPGNS